MLTVFDRPRTLAFEVRGKHLDIDAHFRFELASVGATQVRARFELRPKGFFKVMFVLLTPMIKRDFPKQMGRFKAFCEQR